MHSCLEKTPFMSLVAFTLIFIASGMTCGIVYEAFKRVDNFFRTMFYPVEHFFTIQLAFIGLTAFTAIYAFILLVVGILNTGETRDKLVSKKTPASAQYLVLSYMVYVIWICTFALLAVPVIFWAIFAKVCHEESSYWQGRAAKNESDFNFVFNLTHYGLYRRPLDSDIYMEHISSMTRFVRFCSEVNAVGPMFTCSLLSAMCVLFGINTMIACVSAASSRLKYSVELNRFRSMLTRQQSGGAMGGVNSALLGASGNDYTMQPLNSTMDAPKFAAMSAQAIATMQRQQMGQMNVGLAGNYPPYSATMRPGDLYGNANLYSSHYRNPSQL